MLSPSTTVLRRGGTAFFTTTFYDENGNVVQPFSATINIVYPDQTSGGTDSALVDMVGPTGPAVTWTAQWDSRIAGPGAVSWSIHSDPGPPFAVEDGEFVLKANPANLASFS